MQSTNKIHHNVVEKVYAKIDSVERITKIDTAWHIPNLLGWMEIDSSDSDSRNSRDAYHHAQNNYFPERLENPDGTHRYIYDAGSSPAYREATPKELAAELDEMMVSRLPQSPIPEQEEIKILRAQLKASSDRHDFLQDCIAEMATQFYNV